MWDKHVEMYETTDIPTEYAKYSAYKNEWEEAEEILYNFIMEAIVAKERSKYRAGAFMLCSYGISIPLIISEIYIKEEAEEIAEEMMGYIEDFRSCLLTEEQAKQLLQEIIYYREDFNSASGTLKDVASIIKEIVDWSGDKGLYVGSYLLTFVPDEEDQAYHSRPDTWHRNFGYNVFYDEVFDMGSNMNVDNIYSISST